MRRFIAILLVLTLAFTIIPIQPVQAAESKTVKVERVVDGDTFIYISGAEKIRVRLTGIDTPESVHPDASKNTKWGKKISKWVKKKLTGQTVKLTFDKDKYDRYGRLLAYVYLENKMFNKTLLKKGYARAVYYSPNGKHRKVFNKLQAWAKKHKKGFWKDGYAAAFPG